MLVNLGKLRALLQKIKVLALNQSKIEEWAYTFEVHMVYAITSLRPKGKYRFGEGRIHFLN